MLKHIEFKPKQFMEQPPNVSTYRDQTVYNKQREQWEKHEKQHNENEKIEFETKKEQLFEMLTSAKQEDLLKEIIHLHVLAEYTQESKTRYCGTELAEYNYYSDIRDWLTQLYFHGKHINKNQSHDLLDIHQINIFDEKGDTNVNTISINNTTKAIQTTQNTYSIIIVIVFVIVCIITLLEVYLNIHKYLLCY